MSRTLVSIIVPTYNGARYIGDAIESVLAQNYTDYEVIVVDDGSTDDTNQALEPYLERITYIRQSNQGLSRARNQGVAVSRGEYLSFLDSDDLFLPNKLAAQAQFLDSMPDVGLVASGFQYFDKDRSVLQDSCSWKIERLLDLETILFSGLTVVHGVLIRREWFSRIGGFDPSLSYCEDMDFWYRLSLEGCPIYWLPDIVCQYRLHSGNMTRNIQDHYIDFRAALDKLFADPRVPNHVRQRRDEIYAHNFLSEAGRLYTTGDFENAKDRVQMAIKIWQPVTANNYEPLLYSIVGWQKHVSVRDPDQYLNVVSSNLPIELTATHQHKLLALARKSRFFDSYFDRAFHKVPRLWLETVRFAPSLVLNRGAWSILVRSIVVMAAERFHSKQAPSSAQ